MSHDIIPVAHLRAFLASKREEYRLAAAGWREPDGFLIPTEPDDVDRELIRARIQAADDVMEMLDNYVCDVARIDEVDR